jgi:hypothetical protein
MVHITGVFSASGAGSVCPAVVLRGRAGLFAFFYTRE